MKAKRKQERKRLYPVGVVCHICGLPIPEWLVDCCHPLFGTIDHLVPRSHGGPDIGANRAPAHKLCNSRRGTAEIDERLRAELRSKALAAFSRVLPSVPKTKRWTRLLRQLRNQNVR